MLDNIYMLTSKMQHELSTTSAKRHQKWPEIARENEVPQKMIEEIQSNMVFF